MTRTPLYIVVLHIFALLFFMTAPAPAADLDTCGYHNLHITMEQVPESWTEHGINASYMGLWNEYMDLYRTREDDGTWFINGYNEFGGYPSDDDLHRTWSLHWGSDEIAMTCHTWWGECSLFMETDVVFNPSFSWTMSREYAQDQADAGVVFYDAALVHELGHTWGLQCGPLVEYQFTVPTVMHAYVSHTVQDYMTIHAPDAQLVRRHYDDQTSIKPLSNMAILSKYADDSSLTWQKAETDKTTYVPGETIRIEYMTLENTGTTDLTDVRFRFYLSTNRTITTSDTLLDEIRWGFFPAETFQELELWVDIPSNVTGGTYYLGAIVSINGYGGDDLPNDNWIWLWDTVCITPPVAILNSPTGLGVSTSPTLHWTDAPGATSYDVQVCTNSTCTSVVRSHTVTISQWDVSPALNPATTYYWRVRASNDCGPGEWSDTVSFTTRCDLYAPVLSSPSNGAVGVSTTPLLDWNACAGCDSYLVNVCSDSACASVVAFDYPLISQWTVSPALNPGTTYWWRVAGNATGCGGTPFSTIWSFTTRCVDTPTLITPANGSTGVSVTPVLDWSVVTGATSYNVQVCTDSACATVVQSATVASSTWTLSTALDRGTVYWWRVRARNSCGAGSWSTIWQFQTVCTKLTAPVPAGPPDGSSVLTAQPTLDWGDVKSATSYDVQVCSMSTCGIVARAAEVTESQWTVSPELTRCRSYWWRARAKDACDVSEWSAIWNFDVKGGTPGVPSLVTPSPGATGLSTAPLLDWADVTGATSYDVQVCADSVCATVVGSSTVVDSTWTVSPALNRGTPYWWRVRGKNSCGSGSWSSTRGFQTICTKLVLATLISPAKGSVVLETTPTLDWSAVTGATSYDVQVCTDSSCTSVVRSVNVADSQWAVSPELTPCITYWWRVRARDACSSAPWSDAWSFVIKGPAPGAPALVSPSNGSTDASATPLLNWSDVAGADSYSVRLCTDAACAVVVRSMTVVASEWTVTPALDDMTAYYWQVRSGNACGLGAWAAAWNFTTSLTQLLGDINKDGVVDISDVILDLRIALALDSFKPCSDINGDNAVDISDVILTLRMALGLDPLRQCGG